MFIGATWRVSVTDVGWKTSEGPSNEGRISVKWPGCLTKLCVMPPRKAWGVKFVTSVIAFVFCQTMQWCICNVRSTTMVTARLETSICSGVTAVKHV
jgi:hypothetical protein